MRRLLSPSANGHTKNILLRMITIMITMIITVTTLVPLNVFASYESGMHDGYFYSVWSNDKGTVNYKNQAGSRYTVSWSNNASDFNFTCGKGWSSGSENRVVSYSGSFDPGNNGYLALYGWANQPTGSEYAVMEYYVVESYGSWTPPGTDDGTVFLGTVTSDGATYNIYRSFRKNAPSIRGINEDFYQYWSIRIPKKATGNISGTITFKNHIDAWERLGLEVGDISVYYQIMETEGYGSKGSADMSISEASGSSAWHGLGGLENAVWAIAADKSGRVYIGGEFTDYVAKWENNKLTKLPGLPHYINTMEVDSSGTLYVAVGKSVKKLSGTTWQTVGSELSFGVNAIAFDSNGIMYAAGTSKSGGHAARYVSNKWESLGNSLNYAVDDMVAGDNGIMYLAGKFGVVEYKNGSFTDLGGSLFDETNHTIHAMAYRNKSLYVGGHFSYTKYHNVAKYNVNAKTWSSLHTGANGYVYSLAIDSSDNLYMGGSFTEVGGGTDARGIAIWNGTDWKAVDDGLIEGDPLGRGGVPLVSLYALEFDSSGTLYGGGWFKTSDGDHIAVLKAASNDPKSGGETDYEVPSVRTISLQTNKSDGRRYMYIDSSNKMNPTSTVSPPEKKALYEIHILAKENVNYSGYTGEAYVVALKSLRTGKYLTVVSSYNRVRADSKSISTAQKFHLIDVDGNCCFRSLYNGKVLSYTGLCSNSNIFAEGTVLDIQYWD